MTDADAGGPVGRVLENLAQLATAGLEPPDEAPGSDPEQFSEQYL